MKVLFKLQATTDGKEIGPTHSPVSAATLPNLDADVIDMRRSVVVEEDRDLSDAYASINGESLAK